MYLVVTIPALRLIGAGIKLYAPRRFGGLRVGPVCLLAFLGVSGSLELVEKLRETLAVGAGAGRILNNLIMRVPVFRISYCGPLFSESLGLKISCSTA